MIDKQQQTGENDLGTLAEDARALMAATADVAGEKVGEARKRLAAAPFTCVGFVGCAKELSAPVTLLPEEPSTR